MMTVEELIEKLVQMDKNAIVLAQDVDMGAEPAVIEEVSTDRSAREGPEYVTILWRDLETHEEELLFPEECE